MVLNFQQTGHSMDVISLYGRRTSRLEQKQSSLEKSSPVRQNAIHLLSATHRWRCSTPNEQTISASSHFQAVLAAAVEMGSFSQEHFIEHLLYIHFFPTTYLRFVAVCHSAHEFRGHQVRDLLRRVPQSCRGQRLSIPIVRLRVSPRYAKKKAVPGENSEGRLSGDSCALFQNFGHGRSCKF